ncbi:MAG: VCBS repeat-containing protein [Bryobacteraceae bacterium]|nr:VCBS repeat-containing protein [Bryobacteraceae bacterium]
MTPLNRRDFLGSLALSACLRPRLAAAVSRPVEVRFRKPAPFDPLLAKAMPGNDDFPGEKLAFEIADRLKELASSRALPLAAGFKGTSPMPAQYAKASPDVFIAEFDRADSAFEGGLGKWLDGLGENAKLRFWVLADHVIRYEASSRREGLLEWRVGHWEQEWADGQLTRFEPLDETLITAKAPRFRDISSYAFSGVDSYHRQLARGTPYWRSRLDIALGLDVYGENGIAAADIDNDGWDEVFVCQPGGLPNRLYKNRGDGTFEDITTRSGLDILDETSCALFADFRNSGHQDLVLLRASGPLFFENQGGGRFTHKPEAFRFKSSAQGTFTGMAAADYDNDGRLDLYLCTYIYFQSEDQYRYPTPYHDAQNGPPNYLFRNVGEGVFEDVTESTGINHNNNRYSFCPSWCDYNHDGWMDLYVANDFGRNNLYKNEKGAFRDVAAEAGVEDIGPGMSVGWFDYDGDGQTDLYVSNMWTAAGQRVVREKNLQPAEAYRRHTKGNSLYRNRGDGTFEETGPKEGVEAARWAWCCDGVDFDNDGAPEIFTVAGMITNASEKDLMSFFWRHVVAASPIDFSPSSDYENGWNAINQLIREDYSWNSREPNVMFVRRDGRYYDFSGVSGIDFADDGRAVAVLDLDGDGNLDMLIKNRNGPQVRVFRNECAGSRRSLVLRLEGTRSNRDAIGARVEVDGQVKFVMAGGTYLSQSTKALHFGMGEKDTAQSVAIYWPSGLKQEFHGLRCGFRHQIVEGSDKVASAAFLPRREIKGEPVEGDNSTRLEPTWFFEPLALPEAREGPAFVYLTLDPDAKVPSGLPIQVVDLGAAPADVVAGYGLFRRYLFDWRTGLTAPLLFLIDGDGMVHKVYPDLQDEAALRADLAALGSRDRDRLAIPFPGAYVHRPYRSHFKLGAAFYWAGYPDQALPYLETVLRLEPENFKTTLAVGQIHLEGNRIPQARQYFDRALKRNQRSPELWNNLGILELETGNFPLALQHFEQALAIHPRFTFAALNAGNAYLKMNDAASAEKMFRRALDQDPDDADASNQLGLLCAKQNRSDEALKWFQNAIRSNRKHTGAINNLGVLYMQRGQVNDAIATFQFGVEAAPEDESLNLNLARIYVSKGDRDKAREIMRGLLARKPDSAMAQRALQQLGEP